MYLLKFTCCLISLFLASSGVSIAEYTEEQIYEGIDVNLEIVGGVRHHKPVHMDAVNTAVYGNSEVEIIVVSRYVADSDELVNPSDLDKKTYLSEVGRVVPGSLKVHESPFTGSSDILGGQAAKRGLTKVRQSTAADFDPFKTVLRWHWKKEVSVGTAIKKLAKVVGYTLIIRDPRVGNVYSMPLPYAHRLARSIDVRTGLEFLGGPALMVVVDHANRTIMHMVRAEFAPTYDVSALPHCTPNIAFGLMPAGSASDRVLIVGGKECIY